MVRGRDAILAQAMIIAKGYDSINYLIFNIKQLKQSLSKKPTAAQIGPPGFPPSPALGRSNQVLNIGKSAFKNYNCLLIQHLIVK